MADAKLLTQATRGGDDGVQGFETLRHGRQKVAGRAEFLAPAAPGGAELRSQIDEAEPPAQCEVDQRQRTIRQVHRADHIEVRGHAEIPVRSSVGQPDTFAVALCSLEQRQELAEDLRRIAPVYLLDHQHDWAGCPPRPRGQFEEEAVDQSERAVGVRTITANEVLVGV